MANLTRRYSFKKWAPDIGENRELPGGPVLFLEIATGLSQAQMEAIAEQLKAARSVELAKPDLAALPEGERNAAARAALQGYIEALCGVMVDALSPYVRVHGGPHTVDGQPLATLADFLRLTAQSADMGVNARAELEAAVATFNSMEGPDELFSLRRSGGTASTPPPSAASKDSEMAAR